MKDKRQILLPDSDIISRGEQDLFLEFSLQREFEVLKKDKIDNNFSLREQFRIERNSSRNFCVYGIIDCNCRDVNNVIVELYSETYSTQNLISSFPASSLSLDQKNIFGQKRGKYIFNVNHYTGKTLTVVVRGDGVNFADQIIPIQVVYYDDDDVLIDYGTETIDIRTDGGLIDVNNNFPFFYNRHWVRQNINIIQAKPAIVSFGKSEYNVDEGSSVEIVLTLDKPSPFGTEVVDVEFIYGPSSQDYMYIGPPIDSVGISWAVGEQSKTYILSAFTDNINEVDEIIEYKITNIQVAQPGNTTTHVRIKDKTERKYTNFNFQHIFQERTPHLVGHTTTLRNGYFSTIENEEFYNPDHFKLEITNLGTDSVLPPNAILDTTQEINWPAGETKLFNIQVDYTQKIYEEIEFEFGYANPTEYTTVIFPIPVKVSVDGKWSAGIKNRIEFIDFLQDISINHDPSFVFQNIGSHKVRIKSTSPGHPLNIKLTDSINTFMVGSDPQCPSPSQPGGSLPVVQVFPLISPTIRVSTIQPFLSKTQNPLVVKLAANSVDNLFCSYSFLMSKRGFSTISVYEPNLPAGVTPNNVYLVSSYNGIQFNFDPINLVPTFFPTPSYFQGQVWINGTLFFTSSPFETGEEAQIFGSFTGSTWWVTPVGIIPQTTPNSMEGFNTRNMNPAVASYFVVPLI